MVLATVPAAPPTRKKQRATSWPAPISAKVPYLLASTLICSAFWFVSSLPVVIIALQYPDKLGRARAGFDMFRYVFRAIVFRLQTPAEFGQVPCQQAPITKTRVQPDSFGRIVKPPKPGMRMTTRLVPLAFLLATVAAAQGAITDGLVSYWPLDDNSGGVTPDLSFANTMTVQGSPTVGPGQAAFSNAFTLNGSSTYLTNLHTSDNTDTGLDATNRYYRVINFQTNNTGTFYSCAVTNPGGFAISSNATFTVLDDPMPNTTNGLVNYWPLDVFDANTNSPELHFGHRMSMRLMDTNLQVVAGQFRRVGIGVEN